MFFVLTWLIWIFTSWSDTVKKLYLYWVKDCFPLEMWCLYNKTEFLTDYQKAQYYLLNFDSNKFIKFNNSNNSTIVIRSLHNRITIYNNKLKEVTNYLKNDKVVYNAWCSEHEHFVKTNDFFLNEEDKYINENFYIEEFITLSIIFLSFYYEHSLLVNVGEHNTRVLSNFTKSLINTIEDLFLIVKT